MGQVAKPRGNVTFTANITNQDDTNTETNTTGNPWLSMYLINDGTTSIAIVINSIQVIVDPNEEFDDDFEDFTSIVISPETGGESISYRLGLRS